MAVGTLKIRLNAIVIKLLPHSRQAVRPGSEHGDEGFTLVELLVAISIFAILLGVAVLAVPNHDNRYWQDNLDQLVGALNLAQEESVMTGMPMLAQIDSAGWRFFLPGANGAVANIAGSGLIPDVYRAQAWHKPVEVAALQLTLGGEIVTQAMQIPIKQEQRQAVLLRNRNGRFSWVAGSVQ